MVNDATPTKYFGFPPYTAHPSGGANNWWYVANNQGFNCLSFINNKGAKFTTEENARYLANKWTTENILV